ncbi:MAG TPA: prephenate dehydrogenase/arogenate dehydrogenase family protein [Syntrophales bacterium]|jgi:prephenate dehydrogenase|nr:prephenate dehydrogenase/arogenate dehydrogenase family protein [Syntrophales bacterium]HON22597.1 prephenate dehydrogenase/arogenate dehydrogenase family protein [Syntrophales bacterium]HOU77639.1 prephenate dehydrogenase/arogenate dehydrogenase family protein [Syntrophales bacterium]HPC31991.1 prephenate dehydrogenase/arogenate dehydrogenase family protein [Syntrophales bacterium]HQI36611.1 prephenate dehydrogenase/arogenate dehydrogenase family protein [Syntrophales bacterium]
MKKGIFPIGIIGGTRGMGKWFADFFRRNGYPVAATGRNRGPDLESLAAACPVVVVAVPIAVTAEVIGKIGPRLPPESLLMDLTSLKEGPVRAMLTASRCEVIGLHPLFGPGVTSLSGQNIAVCPARGESWRPWLTDILEKNGARLTETTPARHDEVMAVVQALNHFLTAALGLAIAAAGIDPEELRRFSTPVFRERLDHLHRLLSHPDLYAHLIAGNPYGKKAINSCVEHLEGLRAAVGRGDAAALAERLRAISESHESPRPDPHGSAKE